MTAPNEVLIATRRRDTARLLETILERTGRQPVHFDRDAIESAGPYEPREPTAQDLAGRSVATDQPTLARWADETFEPRFELTLADRDRSLTLAELERKLVGLGRYRWQPLAGPPGPISLLVTRHGPGEKVLRRRLARALAPAAPCLAEITAATEIEGRHVAGWMPLWVAHLADSVTTFPFERPDRAPAPGQELTFAELEPALGERVTYRIDRVSFQRPLPHPPGRTMESIRSGVLRHAATFALAAATGLGLLGRRRRRRRIATPLPNGVFDRTGIARGVAYCGRDPEGWIVSLVPVLGHKAAHPYTRSTRIRVPAGGSVAGEVEALVARTLPNGIRLASFESTEEPTTATCRYTLARTRRAHPIEEDA
jgi:hypothetical protein